MNLSLSLSLFYAHTHKRERERHAEIRAQTQKNEWTFRSFLHSIFPVFYLIFNFHWDQSISSTIRLFATISPYL